MKKMMLVVLMVATFFMVGCDGDNDDDKDNDHDAKISSMSRAVLDLAGASAVHVDKNGCTYGQTWTAPVLEVLEVVAKPNATPPVIGVTAVAPKAGYCS